MGLSDVPCLWLALAVKLFKRRRAELNTDDNALEKTLIFSCTRAAIKKKSEHHWDFSFHTVQKYLSGAYIASMRKLLLITLFVLWPRQYVTSSLQEVYTCTDSNRTIKVGYYFQTPVDWTVKETGKRRPLWTQQLKKITFLAEESQKSKT